MKLLKRSACLRAGRGGNVKPQTALGEGPESELSDRGSTPLISILQPTSGKSGAARNLPRTIRPNREVFLFSILPAAARILRKFTIGLDIHVEKCYIHSCAVRIRAVYACAVQSHSMVFREMREPDASGRRSMTKGSRRSQRCFGSGAAGGSEGVATESDLTDSEGKSPITRKG